MMIEKREECPKCGEVMKWLYDAQICAACGYGDKYRRQDMGLTIGQLEAELSKVWLLVRTEQEENEQLREALRKIISAGTQQGNYTYQVAQAALADHTPPLTQPTPSSETEGRATMTRKSLTAPHQGGGAA